MQAKFVIICGLLALATLSAARPAEEEYEYEDEPAPAPKKPAARPLVGRRNPLAANKGKATSTTTTTTAAPQEEVEEPVEGDYVDEPQPETSSTTEVPKKFIKGGIVRPFRSNDDLLATLKRRREQVVTNKQHKPAAVAAEPKDEASSEPVQKESKPAAAGSSGRRNRFSKPSKSNEVPAEEPGSTAAPARTGRGRFAGRS